MLALAHTGSASSFFPPFLGWLGVFLLTGSDTSSNALFAFYRPMRRSKSARVSDADGRRQRIPLEAHRKMIRAAAHRHRSRGGGTGGESDLFCFTVKHSLDLSPAGGRDLLRASGLACFLTSDDRDCDAKTPVRRDCLSRAGAD